MRKTLLPASSVSSGNQHPAAAIAVLFMNLSRSSVFVFPFPPRAARRSPGPVLVVAAHPDDECVGAATCLLRAGAAAAAVVFLTDGAPRHAAWFAPGQLGASRALYRQRRRREAIAALARLGVPRQRVLFGPITDQELPCQLSNGLRTLQRALRRFRPRWLLVPAYEGGHPDHDAASFLVTQLVASVTGPAPACWEYALYSAPEGVLGSHVAPPGAGWVRARLSARELRLRRQALCCYRSQTATLEWLRRAPECFRPLPTHDYLRPPAGASPVYEQWGMSWTAEALCRAFASFLPRGPVA